MPLAAHANKQLIVALDVSDPAEARRLVSAVGTRVDFFKVGMELYAAAGMRFVDELAGAGKRVFLDLKLYDIAETVKRATRKLAQSDLTFLTVHGSRPVMSAAIEGRGSGNVKLLAVTVLTSFDEEDLRQLGFPTPVAELVRLRVGNAQACGMDGIVCSPWEVAEVRGIVRPGMILVTPGVRSSGAEAGDQKRVATPRQALESGADYIVVGRQVTRAPDPVAAIDNLLTELQAEQ